MPSRGLRRVTIALNLPEFEVPVLILRAANIVESMTGNPDFPDPDPPLAEVQAAIDDLHAAQAATLSRTRETYAIRDRKRTVLVSLLQRLATYVQKIADETPENAAAIIECSGFDVKRFGTMPARTFRAKEGRVSGEVDLVVPSAGRNVAYHWQQSLDGGVTWIDLGDTNTAETTAKGLTRGAQVRFRYRVTKGDVTHDWSDPIGHMVL